MSNQLSLAPCERDACVWDPPTMSTSIKCSEPTIQLIEQHSSLLFVTNPVKGTFIAFFQHLIQAALSNGITNDMHYSR